MLAQNCVYVLACSTWFAFRQGAQLDSSEIYVPHPWRRAWLAIVTSVLCTQWRTLYACYGAAVGLSIAARRADMCAVAPQVSLRVDAHGNRVLGRHHRRVGRSTDAKL